MPRSDQKLPHTGNVGDGGELGNAGGGGYEGDKGGGDDCGDGGEEGEQEEGEGKLSRANELVH